MSGLYGYGETGHAYTPDLHGRCRYAGSGYCDGTRADTQHDRRYDLERPLPPGADPLTGELAPPVQDPLTGKWHERER